MHARIIIAALLLANPIAIFVFAQDPNPVDSAKIGSQNSSNDRKLFNKFHKKLYPLLTHPDKGCVECHNDEGTSNLVLTGNSVDDFHVLLDEQYLKLKGADTLLSRVSTRHGERRMPKDAEAWSPNEVQKLRAFLHAVQDTEEQNGLAADEQFPRSLLSTYRGDKPSVTENQFITFRQLQGKIQVVFDDDWKRGDRDLFSENLAMFGGADFKTRFNESSQPNASFLIGLEMLARDVTNRAYEQKVGPFRDWPVFAVRPSSSDLRAAAAPQKRYRDAIQQLYERVLYRPATDLEMEDAISLLCGVFELEDSIRKRDDELGFEVLVVDKQTGLEQREVIRIPVSGETLEVKQLLLDQSQRSKEVLVDGGQVPNRSNSDTKQPKSLCREILLEGIPLEPGLSGQRLVIHNLDTIRNVSFAGVEILDDRGSRIELIEIDSAKVELEGAWQMSEGEGFKSYEDRGQHKGMSSIRVAIDVPHSGDFQIALRWREDVRNATHVLVEFFGKKAGNQLVSPMLKPVPPIGEAHFYFDCSNDTEPYATPKGSFRFSETGAIEVSNRGTLDTVTVAAIGFVKATATDPSFLIDSKEAVGNDQWKRFDAGRFKAYNVKGALLHDDNKRKGELSLTYSPSTKKDKEWNESEFYRLRVFFPGKKDQECQVPVVVRASQSSPIVRVAYPSLGKSDARMRIDASASYTVEHSKLEFTWRQVSGTRVEITDPNSPTLEFTIPRRSVEQVAWTALCSALLRHPDFLFTRPPSMADCDSPEVKERLRLVKLALDLLGRSPTSQEISQLASGKTLQEFTDIFLDSREFRDFYFHRIRLNLESQGTEVQDEPVRLWSYVATNDRPFQELLTADYTVDSNMKQQPRPAVHGKTGLLTTPGFIQGKPGLPHYNYAAQVSMLFLGFIYEVPAEIVDQRVGVTALGTTDPNSVCYSCHKILTPLAMQRLEWSDEGVHRTKDDDGQPIDSSDQSASEDYPFPGKGMEAFATQAVKKERFIRTIINTHVNFYFGRPMRFREDERELYKRLWDSVHQSNFKIRSLIRDIVTSPEYLN